MPRLSFRIVSLLVELLREEGFCVFVEFFDIRPKFGLLRLFLRYFLL